MDFSCPAEFVEFAHQLADMARPVARQYFRQDDLHIEQKTAHDPVTIADRHIEELWRNAIREHFPQHGIWGEEFGQYQCDAEWVWILDPIDGTKAFTLGRPTFGCLIGLYHRDHNFVLGIVDQPIVDWRWVGIKNGGATLNGTALHTSDVPLHETRIAITNPMRLSPRLQNLQQDLGSKIGYFAFGGDCMNYTGLADGHVHATFDSIQKIYDIAAIIPIIREAGGVISHLDGSAIDFSEDHTIMAAHRIALHDELLRRYQILVDQGTSS